MNLKRANLFSLMLKETAYYDQTIQIEKMIESESDLSQLPAQPLYYSITQLTADKLALCLPLMSKEQRSFLTDLSSWRKDNINVENVHNLALVYAQCLDLEVIQEFVSTQEFLLFLKSRFNLHTFDAENPVYPDHDNYFLTEDTLFLVEFDPEFENGAELKFLIKNFYAKYGVKDSYDLLYGLILETHSSMEEELYKEKVDRLRDFAIVDYYEALKLAHPANSIKQLDSFINSIKAMSTPKLESTHMNQTPHYDLIEVFTKGLNSIESELEKIEDDIRIDYLKFDFSRLIHANLSLEESIDLSKLSLNRIAKRANQFLQVGFYYLKNRGFESIFSEFNFNQIHKIGKSLFHIELKRIKKIIQYDFIDFESTSPFEGKSFRDFIEEARHSPIKLNGNEITSLSEFNQWKDSISFFESFSPFVNEFYKGIKDLKENQSIQDIFYLNYSVEQIDVEALILSHFINFDLGLYGNKSEKKLGVKISELKTFTKKYFKSAQLINESELLDKVNSFQDSFGLDQLDQEFQTYLLESIKGHLEGYKFDELDIDEFEHIGGPILLAN